MTGKKDRRLYKQIKCNFSRKEPDPTILPTSLSCSIPEKLFYYLISIMNMTFPDHDFRFRTIHKNLINLISELPVTAFITYDSLESVIRSINDSVNATFSHQKDNILNLLWDSLSQALIVDTKKTISKTIQTGRKRTRMNPATSFNVLQSVLAAICSFSPVNDQMENPFESDRGCM